MSVLFIALPIALALGASGLIACIYCIRSDQYEDLESPSLRILIDESTDAPPAETASEQGSGEANPLSGDSP